MLMLVCFFGVIFIFLLKSYIDRKTGVPESRCNEKYQESKPDSVVEHNPIEKTANGYVVHDKYGNSVVYHTLEQAEAFRKLQGRFINQTSSSYVNTTNGEITKDWYKTVGTEAVNSEPENDDIVEDASVFISSSDAFLEDCGTYYDGSEYEVSVPKVNHYLPKPAKDDYKRPVAKKAPKVSTEPKFEKLKTAKVYYVLVAFEDGGKEYTYKCDLPDICIGDFVRVKAQGVEKTVRVEDVVDSWTRNIRSKVLRLATDDEVWEWKYGKDEEYEADEETYEDLEPEPRFDYHDDSYHSYDSEERYESERKERRLPSPEEFMADPRLIIEWEIRLPENAEDWWTATTDPRYWMLEYNEWSSEKAAERKREEEKKKQAEEDSWRRYYDEEEEE